MMIRRLILILTAMALAVSCSMSSEYGSVRRFQDGIYYKGFDKDLQQVAPLTEEDFRQLAAEQIRRGQQGRRDTLVVVVDDTWASPWHYYSWYGPHFGWYGGWHNRWYGGWGFGWGGWYDPWYSPWYYGGWYDPWYYGGWYDPWYYGGWYDPWYSPWYYGGYHHYWGYGGGWRDPDTYYYHHDSRSAVKGGDNVGSRGMGSVSRSAGIGRTGSGVSRSNAFGTMRDPLGTRGTLSGSRTGSVSGATRSGGSSYSRSSSSGTSSSGYSRSSGSSSTRSSSSSYSRSSSSSSSSTRSSGSSGSSGGGRSGGSHR